jgi:anti-sigma B factor antagonist
MRCRGAGQLTGGSQNYSIGVTRDPILRVSLRGEIDLAAEPAVVEAFTQALTDNTNLDLVDVDVSGVEFMDSCGLRALLHCRALATAQGVEFTLTVVDGPVSQLLELAGVSELFRRTR